MRFSPYFYASLLLGLVFQIAAAREPIRTWRVLQGPELRGHLIAFRPGKIFVEDERGVVHEIELHELSSESQREITEVGRLQPLKPWRTPSENAYLEHVKGIIHLSGIVRVDSKHLPLYELGFVIGTGQGYSYVSCEPTNVKVPLAQTIPGSPTSTLDKLQMQVTYEGNGIERVADARFHASFPGRVVLKSPFELAKGNHIELASEELETGQSICIVQRNKSSADSFEYQFGWIQKRNSSPRSTGELLSYTFRSESNAIENGAIAVNRAGMVLGVISKPMFRRYAKVTRKPLSSHGYDYLLTPSAMLESQLQPQVLALLANRVKENLVDFAVLYVDPFQNIQSAKLLLSSYDPAAQFQSNAFIRDGGETPSFANATGFSLTSESYPLSLQRVLELPRFVNVLSIQRDMTGIKPEDHVIFYAQVEFTSKDHRTRYSRLFLVNFDSDPERYRKEFALRAAVLQKMADAAQTQSR